jgi:hypothetical protein
MATIYKNVNSAVSPGYGAVPPLTVGYTTNTTAGPFLTTNGSGATNWATVSPNYNIGDGVMKVSGDPATLEVKGKMVLNGRDLEERLDTIEKVLQIPERDVILEKNYPLLKQKYDDYINTLSKYRMWEELKK